MKKLFLIGLLLFSTTALANGYGPPPNWDEQGRAYPEGRHGYPPPRYHENYRYERHEYRYYQNPAWTCDWSSRYGWDCRIWHTSPPYRRW